MPPIVRIADPRGSTPTPFSLIGVALGCTAMGLLLVRLSLATPRPETGAPEPAPAGGAPSAALDDGASAQSDLDAEPVVVAAESPTEGVDEAPNEATGNAQPPQAPAVPEPTPSPSEQAGAGPRVEPGRVAYFQCPNDSCPRDHGLERSVWRTLERSESCLSSPGEADVRVSVAGGAVSDVRFRERGAAGLDIGALHRCVSAPLMRITGSSLPDGAVVSFRFEVR